MKINIFAFATLLAGTPVCVLAQQTTGPGIGADSSKGIAAEKAGTSSPTAESAATSGATPPSYRGSETTVANNGAARHSNTPGATGNTIVPGSTSTIAGDRTGTANAKTNGAGSGGGDK